MITIKGAGAGPTGCVSVERLDGGRCLLRIDSPPSHDGSSGVSAQIVLMHRQAQFLGLLLASAQVAKPGDTYDTLSSASDADNQQASDLDHFAPPRARDNVSAGD